MSAEIPDIKAKEFFEGLLCLDFMTEEERETIYSAAELYATGRVRFASQSTSVSTKANGEAEGVAGDWKVISHSYPIADTGDYDGHCEITNGKISLFTKDDPDDKILESVANVLNASNCKFWINDRGDEADQAWGIVAKLQGELEASTPKVEAEDVEALAEAAIPEHPYPDMEYPASALTKIKRECWKDGYNYKAAQSTPKEAPQVAVECYVPIDVEKELPLKTSWHVCIDPNSYPIRNEFKVLRYREDCDQWSDYEGNGFHPTYWLKKTTLYTKP